MISKGPFCRFSQGMNPNQSEEEQSRKHPETPIKPPKGGSEFNSIPCAIYTRVSSDEQARPEHYSLSAQEDYGMTEIKRHAADGWIHKITIIDDGYSGADFNRPGLLRMVNMVKKGEIKVIIAYLRDRLWRDGSIAADVQVVLDQHDVSILTKQGTHDRSPHSKFLSQVLDANSQLDRANIRMRINDNMRFAAKRGDWKGGTPSFGYSYIPGEKTMRVHEKEASTVRLIFERIASGISTADVVKELRSSGLYGRAKGPRRSGR